MISGISPILNVAAEVIVDFNVAMKNQNVYGTAHPSARASVRRAMEKIEAALHYQPILDFHYAKNTIIFGQNYLDRKNPIYRQHASTLWSLGLIGLSLKAGLNTAELSDCIDLFNAALKPKLKTRDKKDLLSKAAFPHIGMEFLDTGRMRVSRKDEIAGMGAGTEEKLWKGFIEALAGPRPGEADELMTSKSVTELAKKISRKHMEEGQDYGGAVVDYLKKLDLVYRQKGLLMRTETGQKISEFINTIDPGLRQQILASSLAGDDLSPGMVEDLARMVGSSHLVDSLKKLNAQGRAIPVAVYRTLSLISMLDQEGAGGDGGEAAFESQAEDSEQVQSLLDSLLSEDDRFSYISPEYEAKIENLQEYAENMAKVSLLEHSKALFARGQTEKHFMGVASELVEMFPRDVELAGASAQQMNPVFTHYFGQRQYAECQTCILLKKRAALLDPKQNTVPFAWEEEKTLDALLEVMTASDHDDSLLAGRVLGSVGPPAITRLMSVLSTSEDMEHRQHAVTALADMEESPAKVLMDLARKEAPWYLHRNIVHVFRRRRDLAGEAVIRGMWDGAHPKTRIEIIRYMYAIRRKEWLDYFRQAMQSGSRDLMQGAARLVLSIRWDEVVDAITSRLDGLPAWSWGSPFHVTILRYLVQSGSPRAKAYVAGLPATRKRLWPGQKSRLRKQVTRLLGEGAA